MRFIQFFFASVVVLYLAYCAVVLKFIDSPIRAEYWVNEMIMIKKELVKRYTGRSKIIIAGGSSALFGFDADYASRQLGMPVINFGLHAGLRLDKILRDVDSVIEPGDVLVLALEPNYFDCSEKLNTWQVNNIIGWDHDSWEQLSYTDKFEFITLISPSTFAQMILTAIQKKYYPARVYDRLMSLDRSAVLGEFDARTNPMSFEYSAFHLDNNGDMLKTEGAKYQGAGSDLSKPIHVCGRTANQLLNFAESMRKKRVQVYFANAPYISPAMGRDEVTRSEINFQKELIAAGCFIDKREDLVFDKNLFFNTNLHLNSEGRATRTGLFIDAMRKNVFSGGCPLPSGQ